MYTRTAKTETTMQLEAAGQQRGAELRRDHGLGSI